MQHRALAHLLQRPCGQHRHLPHARQRDPIAFLPAPHHQRRGDEEGERQVQRELRADAAHGFDVDVAVHALDDPPDHIHADPAAGLVPDLFGRREPRQEDKLDGFGFRHVLGDVGTDQSPLDRLGPNPLDIEAGAVVFDFDQDGVAAMGGMEINGAGCRLPFRHA